MKKILHVLLSLILLLILICCLMILLYAKNEDFAEFVRNNSDKFPRPVADVVEDNNEYA